MSFIPAHFSIFSACVPLFEIDFDKEKECLALPHLNKYTTYSIENGLACSHPWQPHTARRGNKVLVGGMRNFSSFQKRASQFLHSDLFCIQGIAAVCFCCFLSSHCCVRKTTSTERRGNAVDVCLCALNSTPVIFALEDVVLHVTPIGPTQVHVSIDGG